MNEYVGVMWCRLGPHIQLMLSQMLGAIETHLLVIPIVVYEFEEDMAKKRELRLVPLC